MRFVRRFAAIVGRWSPAAGRWRLVAGHWSFVVRRSSVVGRPSSIVVRRSSVVGRPSSIVGRPSSFVVRPSSFVHRPLAAVLTLAGLTALACAAGSAAEIAKTQAVELMATGTALAARLEPSARAALTRAAEYAATGRAVVGSAIPATIAPEVAEAVVQTYAREVLGVEVTVARAGGFTNDVADELALPSSGAESQTGAQSAAYATYGALLSNGAASVSYGQRTLGGDIGLDLRDASLGAFSFRAETAPADEAEALARVRAAFPALADRGFEPVRVPGGFAWTFEGQAIGASGGPVAERVLVGVESGLGRTIVYAVVGRGELSGQVRFPGP